MEEEKKDKADPCCADGKCTNEGACCDKNDSTCSCEGKCGCAVCRAWSKCRKWHCGGSRRILWWILAFAVLAFFYCIGYHAGRWSVGDYDGGYYRHGRGMMIERIYYSPNAQDGGYFDDSFGPSMMWR